LSMSLELGCPNYLDSEIREPNSELFALLN
jgi:hypothetical protein